MTSAIRLRRLLAEDRPQIIGYDEAAFAQRLHYDRPIEASLAAFHAARLTTAELLDRMDAAAWERAGTPVLRDAMVGVNVSWRQVSRAGLVDEVVAALDEVVPTLASRDEPLLLDVVIAPTTHFAP
jgi:hypothetical protein